jgi:hypothetical protein
MKSMSPAILAAAMLAGYTSAGIAHSQTPPASGSAKTTGGTGGTGVNAGTAEGEGKLSGGASIGARKDTRRRSVTGATSGATTTR